MNRSLFEYEDEIKLIIPVKVYNDSGAKCTTQKGINLSYKSNLFFLS